MKTQIPFVAPFLALVAFASQAAAQLPVGALPINQRQGDQWGWAVDYSRGGSGCKVRVSGCNGPVIEEGLGLDRAMRRQIQERLHAEGFDPGSADGLVGPQTRAAIRRWQASRGTPTTGYLDGPSAAALRSAGGASPAAAAVAPAGSPPVTMSSTNPAAFEAHLQQFPNGPVPADETCAGKPEGATCWMQVYQRPDCYVWNQRLELGATVTWTGECAGGVAQGAGTLTWTWNGIQRTDAGRVVDGRPHGHWVLRYPNQESSPHGWNVLEGPYVNGMAHGHWLLRATTSGRTSEGPLVDGQQTGHWVTRFADGNIMKGPYVNGVEHGRWIWRSADGDDVAETLYEEGEERGFRFLKLVCCPGNTHRYA